jgi:hypothetical protein
MQIQLSSALSRLLAAALLLVAGGYWFAVQRDYRAAAWADAATRAGLERAIQIEPRRAEYHHRLGRFLLFVEQDPAAAKPALLRATALDPHVPWYWLDLATAGAVSGDMDAHRNALLRASQSDPRTPVVAWEVANLMLVDGKFEAALPLFRTVVENDPASAERVYDLCWRTRSDIDLLLRSVTPSTVEAHLALLNVMVAHDAHEAAQRVWSALTALPQPVVASRAMPYVNYLVRTKELARADEAMQWLARNHVALQTETRGAGLPLVNPGFEEEYIPGPFSWTLQANPAVRFQIDGNEFHGGTRSLRLDFTGTGFRLSGLTQYIRVPEHTPLELSVFVKANQIKTPLGPRLLVQDAYTHEVLATGREWIGSNAWREERLLFTTRDNGLIALRIARDTVAGSIAGSMWIDDLKVVRR